MPTAGDECGVGGSVCGDCGHFCYMDGYKDAADDGNGDVNVDGKLQRRALASAGGFTCWFS